MGVKCDKTSLQVLNNLSVLFSACKCYALHMTAQDTSHIVTHIGASLVQPAYTKKTISFIGIRTRKLLLTNKEYRHADNEDKPEHEWRRRRLSRDW